MILGMAVKLFFSPDRYTEINGKEGADMGEIILQAQALTKVYQRTRALDQVNLCLEKGNIYGFIGENGAGKTTFLRIICGLAFPTSGTLSLWGHTGDKQLQRQRRRIGCMIETPALFPGLTAYQNMQAQRIQRGIPDKAVIDEALYRAGLKGIGRKLVNHYSLGMRQRLGIAMAIMNMPELLILDEPINGLDPAGIADIRALIKGLNRDYGMTILVSSHILAELQQTASRFILIHQGAIVEELTARQLNERCRRHILIRAQNPQAALLALTKHLMIQDEDLQLMPDESIRLYSHLDDVEGVARTLNQAEILVTGLGLYGDSLEDYFLGKVGGRS